MEENRFKKCYQDYRLEKQQESNANDHNKDRFACLLEHRVHQGKPPAATNRFACLIDDDYGQSRYNQQWDRPRPPLNTIIRPRSEIVWAPKPPPPLTIDSKFHFPDLVKSNTVPEKVSIEQLVEKLSKKSDESPVKLVEQINEDQFKLQKAVIVSRVQIKREPTYAALSMKNGKLVVKDIYEDGTFAEEEKPPIIIKKPIYSSWAAVLKPKLNQIVYYKEEAKGANETT
jgi:hypothetical protein